MRIAILTSSYPRYPGDVAAPFVKSIAEAMAKSGHSIEVVAPYDPQVQKGETGSVRINRFIYFPIKSFHIMGHGRALEADVRLQPLAYFILPFYLLGAFYTLWRVTGRQKSDAIHVHWVLPNGPVAALVAKFRRIPFLVSLHGSDIYIAEKNHWFGRVASWVFHHAAAVTACSPDLKTSAEKLGAPATTELLAWGADPMVFMPSVNREALRTKYGWFDEIIIVALGRLVYKKGFQNLIQALPSVKTRNGRIKLVIGGDGPLSSELNNLALSLGIMDVIDFVGQVPWNDVPDLFSAADIFVLPSVRDASGNMDGLPTVLLEAMGSGLAIIASDISGVPLVVRDQENGILVTPGSVDELTDKLVSLINNAELRKSLGNAARKSVLDEFNWDNVAQRILNLLSASRLKISREAHIGINIGR